jgi:hypothetical protein
VLTIHAKDESQHTQKGAGCLRVFGVFCGQPSGSFQNGCTVAGVSQYNLNVREQCARGRPSMVLPHEREKPLSAPGGLPLAPDRPYLELLRRLFVLDIEHMFIV